MFEARYSFLKGRDGGDVPFAVYVENEYGRVVFSSGIYVDKKTCDIPKELEEFCLASPSEESVRENIEKTMKNLMIA